MLHEITFTQSEITIILELLIKESYSMNELPDDLANLLALFKSLKEPV